MLEGDIQEPWKFRWNHFGLNGNWIAAVYLQAFHHAPKLL